jgi:hypothetical protein
MNYKRCKVVLIPCEPHHHPVLLLDRNRLSTPKKGNAYPASEYQKVGYSCYNLIIVGYDPVTKPCFVFNENGVGFENKVFEVNTDIAISNCLIHNWNEIVASSLYLSYTIKTNYIQFGDNVEETKVISVPSIPEDFIKTYVDSFNKAEQIEFVNVEYNEVSIQESLDNYENDCVYVNGVKVFSYPSEYQNILERQALLYEGVKLNSDNNTINLIKSKGTWTYEEHRKEMIDLIQNLWDNDWNFKGLAFDEFVDNFINSRIK